MVRAVVAVISNGRYTGTVINTGRYTETVSENGRYDPLSCTEDSATLDASQSSFKAEILRFKVPGVGDGAATTARAEITQNLEVVEASELAAGPSYSFTSGSIDALYQQQEAATSSSQKPARTPSKTPKSTPKMPSNAKRTSKGNIENAVEEVVKAAAMAANKELLERMEKLSQEVS
ncbi:hypothetical protein HDU85_006548, partial [Gaertneriomyces sp. JEL0708]